MTRTAMPAWERAARALCRLEGAPENVIYGGRPMWIRYLAEVRAVLMELRTGGEGVPDRWTAAIDAMIVELDARARA